MFNAYEYGLLRQGLRLLDKACAAHGDVEGIKDLFAKLDAIAPAKALSELQAAILLPKDEACRGKFIRIFETRRELLSAMLPYVLKEPRSLLVLFPSPALARKWADEVSDNLSDSTRRLVRKPSLRLEFTNGSAATFGSTQQTYCGFHYDVVFVLNHLAGE